MIIKKRIFFFDVDETLFSNEKEKILSQTKKLIFSLFNKKNIILGIATGRNYHNLDVLKDIISCFKYFVLANGSFTMKNDKIIDQNPIPKEYIIDILNKINLFKYKIAVANIGSHEEALFYNGDKNNLPLIRYWQKKFNLPIDNLLHLKKKIFLMNLFSQNNDQVEKLLKEFNCFNVYFWENHIDLTMKNINKYYGIKKIKEKYPDYELVCIGDGCNDKEMLANADISIAMGNSQYDEIKKNSDFIAPHIEENGIFDFFKKNNLI
ncbi:HAD family hydrolase [Candidatus Phytoplasma palmae]|uniref:HAD family hydrolase n=1 Tax=Candidatus Phytoplasma palmae TaxID=85624 RepID=UPI003990D646